MKQNKIERITIEQINIKKLKGLHDITIDFSDSLTAIMGINGVGKTSIIHALACLYQPDGKGENYIFSQFFPPNTDDTWKNSEFTAVFYNEEKNIKQVRKYGKKTDRWAPRYTDRPKRNIYYIGINSCLPDIERISPKGAIHYVTKKKEDKVSDSVIKEAATILNIGYLALTENIFKNRELIGVETKRGFKYSSLSMGTGEQRIIKILQTILSAEAYSLILIDEIDLLLHVSAFKRLIRRLSNIAKDRKLQIIFTTHSLEVLNMEQYVKIQYIHAVKKSETTEELFVYDKINDDLIQDLTGEYNHPIKIYVEDELSKAIIKTIAKKNNISSKISIIKFGSLQNGFSLAAGKQLSQEDTSNTLIVFDGDDCRTDDERMVQMKKYITGTEDDIEDKRKQALKLISQYLLPKDCSPEKFIYDLLCSVDESDNEIVKAAREINAVNDNHDLIKQIKEKLQESEEGIVKDIVKLISDKPELNKEWTNFTKLIDYWMKDRVNV